MKKWKWTILIGIIWIITIIVAWKSAWDIRGNQYRRCAAQSLKDAVLGSLIQTKTNIEADINNNEPISLEIIGYRFQEIDMLRQKMHNIYKKEDPGAVSTSPSVWMDCGGILLALYEKEELTNDQIFFLENLYRLCQTYVDVFSLEGQGMDEFEYYLRIFEEELESFLEPMRYLVNATKLSIMQSRNA